MKKFKNSEEFKAYKIGLQNRIDELEGSLDLSPQALFKAVNPFKNLNQEVKGGNPLLKTALNFLPKFLITKALGKNLNPLTSALIPLAATGAGKVMDEIEQQGFVEKILDRVISATTLTAEDKMILEAAEIENQIEEVEESITNSANKIIHI